MEPRPARAGAAGASDYSWRRKGCQGGGEGGEECEGELAEEEVMSIVALSRSEDNRSKLMQKIDLSPYLPEVGCITQEPISVISHGGSLESGHYIVYSNVTGVWYLNDDQKKTVPSMYSPFEQNNIYRETAVIIIFENKV